MRARRLKIGVPVFIVLLEAYLMSVRDKKFARESARIVWF